MVIIEAGCSHNNGRSTLTEGFGNQYLEKKGEESKRYKVTSSGTHANLVNDFLWKNGSFPDDVLLKMAKLYLEKNLIGRENKTNIENILRKDNPSKKDFHDLSAYLSKSLLVKVDEESEYRGYAFKKFNLKPVERVNKQTVANSDVRLFLGMGKENVEIAERLYQDAKTKRIIERVPVIETLAGYGNKNPGEEFDSAFGGTLNDYLEMAEVIRAHTHKSLDRALKEI